MRPEIVRAQRRSSPRGPVPPLVAWLPCHVQISSPCADFGPRVAQAGTGAGSCTLSTQPLEAACRVTYDAAQPTPSVDPVRYHFFALRGLTGCPRAAAARAALFCNWLRLFEHLLSLTFTTPTTRPLQRAPSWRASYSPCAPAPTRCPARGRSPAAQTAGRTRPPPWP